MANHAPPSRRQRRLFRFLLVLVVAPTLIATDLLGTVPDSPISARLRQAVSVALPPEFVEGLNTYMEDYGIPTLPPAPEEMQPDDEIGVEATSEAVGQPDADGEATSEPLATAIPVDETASSILEADTFQAQTPEMDISGTWTYHYFFDGHEEYTFEDVVVIEKQGSGYAVTSVTCSYGPVALVDQYWNGSYLEFYYEMPASTFPWETDHTYLLLVKTLGMENGHLVIIDEVGDVYEMTRSE